ncbi:MAG TPA: sigma factor-like helix-turn-helix DNA-binding protein [Thermoanaerobaculia bacterium]|nr:sigma factor-like helix-turn-helix DNA-binding protein [Thermoanaerobaculia bacterium]
MSPDEIVALYDEHSPRLYALALRILGDEQAAAEVLEEVFVTRPLPTELGSLIHLTRDLALARPIQSGGRSVDRVGGVPAPRLLVEEAFYRGRSVSDLARAFSIDEETVRSMLREGMAALREQVAAREK